MYDQKKTREARDSIELKGPEDSEAESLTSLSHVMLWALITVVACLLLLFVVCLFVVCVVCLCFFRCVYIYIYTHIGAVCIVCCLLCYIVDEFAVSCWKPRTLRTITRMT